MSLLDITQDEKDSILTSLKILVEKLNTDKYQALPGSYLKDNDKIKFEIIITKRKSE